jgi:hypothetical protein
MASRIYLPTSKIRDKSTESLESNRGKESAVNLKIKSVSMTHIYMRA